MVTECHTLTKCLVSMSYYYTFFSSYEHFVRRVRLSRLIVGKAVDESCFSCLSKSIKETFLFLVQNAQTA